MVEKPSFCSILVCLILVFDTSLCDFPNFPEMLWKCSRSCLEVCPTGQYKMSECCRICRERYWNTFVRPPVCPPAAGWPTGRMAMAKAVAIEPKPRKENYARKMGYIFMPTRRLSRVR